jgi:surface polysaccharide O-acyltransferase-like enzyme
MNTEHYYGSLLEILWIISLFTLMLRIRLNENQQRRIEQISTLTFSVYMIHPVIGAMVRPTPETNILGYIILLVIVITPSLLVAVLINKLPTKLRNSLVKI